MYKIESTPLFSDVDLASSLNLNKQRIADSVDAISQEQLLSTNIDTLCEYIVGKLAVNPLVLYEDKMTMQHEETKINVTGRIQYGGDGSKIVADGYLLKFNIPYTGSSDFWRARPNTYIMNPPNGNIDTSNHILTLSFENTVQTEEIWFKEQLECSLTKIRQNIATQLIQINQYNSSLAKDAQEMIAQRREQLLKLQGLVSSFSIPLTKNTGMPQYTPIEISSRRQIQLPKFNAVEFKPEPAIPDETYEDILANIRHMGATFEGTPQTYQALGEDGLRDILLASLNGYYKKGHATGESFRHYGKTDIRIEEATRSAFVAECKLWAGQMVLTKALNQLLDYLTWRDCKAAIVLFNKTVSGFSGIQKIIDTELLLHESFIRKKSVDYNGEWRYVFRSREDGEREVTVHIFCFNLFVAPDRAKKR